MDLLRPFWAGGFAWIDGGHAVELLEDLWIVDAWEKE
jgi:hypothetical protein